MSAGGIPIARDRREVWRRDPAAYEAVERLHDSAEALIGAIDHQVNITGALFTVMHEPERTYFTEKGSPLPTAAQLLEARRSTEDAQARWAAAVCPADALLRERQSTRRRWRR